MNNFELFKLKQAGLTKSQHSSRFRISKARKEISFLARYGSCVQM